MGCLLCKLCFCSSECESDNADVDLSEASGKWSIVYRDEYNISACGIEKLHPFDAGKWGKVYRQLLESEQFPMLDQHIYTPSLLTWRRLEEDMSDTYLSSLCCPCKLAAIIEVPCVICSPPCLSERILLKPMRYQTGGTVLAAKLALVRGWAINIGGGFHHASINRGGGFCVYPDITIAIYEVRRSNPSIITAIIDLDAHQGNGHERDFMRDDKVRILDMYNESIYPRDSYAKQGINVSVPLHMWIGDQEYLANLRHALKALFSSSPLPDLIVYNAGTDVLKGDPLGAMNITPAGVVTRDEIVFLAARSRNIPIVMVTSGGYTAMSAPTISKSILNLKQKGLIEINPLSVNPHRYGAVSTSSTMSSPLRGIKAE